MSQSVGYQNVSSQARWLILSTLLLATLPSLFHLPWWLSFVVFSAALWNFAPARWRKGWADRIFVSTLLVSALLGIHFSFDAWFGGRSILAFLVVVVFLKWTELHNRRDAILLIFAACLLSAVGAMYWQNLLSMLHMMLIVFALVASLLALNDANGYFDWRATLKQSLTLFALALPLTAVLFVSLPRIPGPLWDFGLTLGLPIKLMMEKTEKGLGVGGTLGPSTVSGLKGKNGVVLVAEFENGNAVPYKDQMYWRGPVFYDYDGTEWSLGEKWQSTAKLKADYFPSKASMEAEILHLSDTPLRYKVKVPAHGLPWLYGLDLPFGGAPESYITKDYQLLSIRGLKKEFEYEMVAHLDYAIGKNLPEEKRQRSLKLNEGDNPRLVEFGEQLKSTYPSPSERVDASYRAYAGGDFTYSEKNLVEAGANSLDRFFFDIKKGGSQYLAGSLVVMMRAAGVPARLVTGYRGGTLVALTSFVIVKQADAHAWAEVWLEGEGWKRVDAKDFVSPPQRKGRNIIRIEQPVEKHEQQTDKADKPKEQAKQASPTSAQSASSEKVAQPVRVESAKSSLAKRWSELTAGLEKWVLRYNPTRQIEIFSGSGSREVSRWGMLVWTVIVVIVLLITYGFVAMLRGRKAQQPAIQAYQMFCKRMSKISSARKVAECADAYCERLVAEHPELEPGIRDITQRFNNIYYGKGNDVREFKRQVQRFVAMV